MCVCVCVVVVVEGNGVRACVRVRECACVCTAGADFAADALLVKALQKDVARRVSRLFTYGNAIVPCNMHLFVGARLSSKNCSNVRYPRGHVVRVVLMMALV